MNVLERVVDSTRILLKSLRTLALGRASSKDIWKQTYEFGNSSIGIVVLCVTFVGIILISEYSFHMKLVIGNDSMIPGFAMILLMREIAPIIGALLITSKMGASMAAELAAMKNTEQIDAYRLLGLDIVELYVAPRTFASAVSAWSLATISLGIAIMGSWFAAVTFLNFSTGPFFQSLFIFVSAQDMILMSLKAVIFGACIPSISAHYGLQASFGAEGVGHATTDAVVGNSITIIILDFVITYFYAMAG
jgi:phospholipid/cholesterol/gamma-HCH transport system permease protein